MRTLTFHDIMTRPVPRATERLAYGTDSLQFGDLYLPPGPGPHPVAVLLHGGCWLSEYELNNIGHLAAALADAGVAAWSLEYRRIGNPGGGWPGTFQDVALGTDHLRELAQRHPLDLERVVAVGHSAGGHLALWLAARDRLPATTPGAARDPLPLRGVVSLAGIADLRAAAAEGVCGDAALQLLGGSPFEVPERYERASPADLLPLGVPQRLVQGARDEIVPLEFVRRYAEAARMSGDHVRLTVVEDAAHFEMIAPWSNAWGAIRGAVFDLLGTSDAEM